MNLLLISHSIIFLETKLDESKLYSSLIIGDKIFYYIFDYIITDRKIISGLILDINIYLNKDNDKKILIDTKTISIWNIIKIYINKFRICSLSV